MLNRLALIFMLLAWVYGLYGQKVCTLCLHGEIHDRQTHAPVPFAKVLLLPDKQVMTDETGAFEFNALCPGEYDVWIWAPGYESQKRKLKIQESVGQWIIHLMPLAVDLEEVEIVENKKVSKSISQAETVIQGAELQQQQGKQLGAILQSIPGVQMQLAGPNITKPMIHGLTGNRVLIINNGIRHEGQQWGNDHAPEIDPYLSDRITVVKGPRSIIYGAEAIAGVIIAEPPALSTVDTAIRADLYAHAQSNGRGGSTSVRLHGATKGWGWLVQGTVKRLGYRHTPKYVLENTGEQELNLQAALAHDFGYGRHLDIYYSRVGSKVGILRDAHIGNVDDLQRLIAKPDSLYSKDFAYRFLLPYQQISHQMARVRYRHEHSSLGNISLQLSYQHNDRAEYDRHGRIGANLQRPALRFVLDNWLAEANAQKQYQSNISVIYGTALGWQQNLQSGRYFVPWYQSPTLGFYLLPKYTAESWVVEAGLRYDWKQYYITQFRNQPDKKVTRTFNNATLTAGVSYLASETFTLKANIANAWRPPTMPELYAFGVHHASASFEVGDSTLKPERMWGGSVTGLLHDAYWQIEANVYSHYSKNFIYLTPTGQFIQRQNGAFPRFDYKSAEVFISGWDVYIKRELPLGMEAVVKLAQVFAHNLSNNTYLVWMPADRMQSTLLKQWRVSSHPGQFHTLSISWQGVRRQLRAPTNVDFAPPPPAYQLWGAEWTLGAELGKHHELWLSFAVDNIFNTAYRDYLNRFRYFAYEPGRNINCRVKYVL